MARYKIVKVCWQDSEASSGWEPSDSQLAWARDEKIGVCESIGVLVHKGRNSIALVCTVAHKYHKTGGEAEIMLCLKIPRKTVISIETVGHVEGWPA